MAADTQGNEDVVAALLEDHIDEIERTVRDGTRENAPDARRDELGAAYPREGDRRLPTACGSVESVRAVVRG
ncbi:hypothetical protein [Streptomyces sp. NPDC093225]|uniref:hypothetical protein n=1 Tax=Streptomyces sp. NPDC093225 TaxID=3366034 RepID=UPI00382A6A24